MPAQRESLDLTDRYRQRLADTRALARSQALRAWGAVDVAALDASYEAWRTSTTLWLLEVQRAAVRLSAGYVGAYLMTELGGFAPVPPVDSSRYVGASVDGKPLEEALQPSLYTVKAALGDGKDPNAALAEGMNRAVRLAGEVVTHAGRTALHDALDADERFVGWRRVVRPGACLACLALADGRAHETRAAISRHPSCDCTAEPVVAGVTERYHRPTGREYFDRFSPADQDHIFGAEKAELVRSGAVPLEAFVQRQPMAEMADGITEAPLEALQAQVA